MRVLFEEVKMNAHNRLFAVITILLLVLPSYGAASPYSPNSFVNEVLAEYLPNYCIIFFNKLETSETYKHHAQKFERELVHILLSRGYVLTYTGETEASFRFRCKIIRVESNFSFTDPVLHLLITIDKLPDQEKILNRQVAIALPKIPEETKRFDVIGDLNFLVGSEAEFENLRIDDNTESRTSSVNERDMEMGVCIHFPKEDISSIITVRTRNSFGRDDLKLYRASFSVHQWNTTLLCGIYPLKFGQASRYLNATLERPYWNTGLFFDSTITGLSIGKPYKNTMITFYCGANRNPSMVLATQWKYTNYRDAENNYIDVSLHGLYVNRDDEFNDIGGSTGMEVTWQRGEKLFLYALSGINYFNGTGVNLERTIIPFFCEYEYALTENIIIKGAYLAMNHNVEGEERMRDVSLYQEVDYRVTNRWVPGLQFERFIIKGFWENNYTLILYCPPRHRFSEKIHKIGITGKIRYIKPKIGEHRFFVGFEGTIAF